MEVSSIKNSLRNHLHYNIKGNVNNSVSKIYRISQNNKAGQNVSFGSKQLLFNLRKLSNYMKEPSEVINAGINMIGTGLIAPFAIMCSPKKPCSNPSPSNEKEDREKKFFQAIRQPVSAVLAFGFQMPTTIGIYKGLNYLAYKKHWEPFNDDVLGTLIPEKKYLKAQAKLALKENASPELKTEWAEELKIANNREKIHAELKEKLRKEYEEVGIKISDSKLEEKANNKREIKKFITEKMAKAKHEKLIDAKVKELKTKVIERNDLDLVTEDYQNLAKKIRFKKEFEKLRKDANLNWFDKFLKSMGLSNKKLRNLEEAEKDLAKRRGLDLLKEDMGLSFSKDTAKLRKFIETRCSKAQKLFNNKIFWLSLAFNLVMVAISCVALNWFHPKLASFIDKNDMIIEPSSL